MAPTTASGRIRIVLWPLALSLLLLAAPASGEDCAWATAETRYCCENHNRDYAQGGTERQREITDGALRYCLEMNGADAALADAVYTAARRFGGVRCRGYRCWRYPSTPAETYRVYNEGLGWGHSYRRR